jgi:uncharacterized protein YxeA
VKKIITIVYIFLAIFFCSKDLICFISSAKYSSYAMEDLDQKESKEETGKESLDEKEDAFKDGRTDSALAIILLHQLDKNYYQNCTEKKHKAPYFEVVSPPPDLV